MSTSIRNKIWLLTPTFGAIVFAALYVIATFYYPGGSQAGKNSTGFRWTNNYWCNLLNDRAINGQKNAAQPVALTAMVTLGIALTFFWWVFPCFTPLNKTYKLTMQSCGIISVLISLLLFTPVNHDLITNLSSALGLIAMALSFIGLYRNRWRTLLLYGLFNILLVLLNNFLYYDKNLITYLPFVQKITFLSFLIWVCLVNIKIVKQ